MACKWFCQLETANCHTILQLMFKALMRNKVFLIEKLLEPHACVLNFILMGKIFLEKEIFWLISFLKCS